MSLSSKKRPSFQFTQSIISKPLPYQGLPVTNNWTSIEKSPVDNERRPEVSISSAMESGDEDHHDIPAAVVDILKDCKTPDEDMQEMLTECLLSANRILPCNEAKKSERLKGRLTADQIAAELRQKCVQ